MKDGKKSEKVIGVKKVNKYTKEQCQKELARLEIKTVDHNDSHKSGEQVNSKYYRDIQKQLLILG